MNDCAIRIHTRFTFESNLVHTRFTFESNFGISVSGCKLTILPDIQPANRIVIISGTKACFSPLFFVAVFMLISPDVDLTLFVTFITTCKMSSIKIWFLLAARLAENLTQVVFRQPFVIQHVRTRLLSCET